MAQSGFHAVGGLSDTLKQEQIRTGNIARTQLEIQSLAQQSQTVDVTIKNTGQTALKDFKYWDVVVQYYQSSGTYHQVYLPYSAAYPPANNEWAVKGIYIDAGAGTHEIFEPNIFDPGEQIIIELNLSPAANAGSNQLVIGVANGVTASALF